MYKVLVLGGSGLVGKAITAEMGKYEYEVYSTYFNNPFSCNQNRSFKLNIEESNSISSILNHAKPQIVISA